MVLACGRRFYIALVAILAWYKPKPLAIKTACLIQAALMSSKTRLRGIYKSNFIKLTIRPKSLLVEGGESN
ncbi:hypothetical protein C1E24_18375 [Pseudoalteromonas phenolica]|uniref:Uncharacterized protein n=1 Tax=Pseudoalteromonas phenolica TaxID=161398 RepID=A0A5R9PZJ6_9GAMM|nr:hypothetical protein C1E24_18375 [Pseudoalteromonas phenolica]